MSMWPAAADLLVGSGIDQLWNRTLEARANPLALMNGMSCERDVVPGNTLEKMF